MIGIGTAGVIGATAVAYVDAVEAPSTDEAAYPADFNPPINRTPGSTTTTSMAPSYSPRIHTRSRGS